jgi:hypothetical protein
MINSGNPGSNSEISGTGLTTITSAGGGGGGGGPMQCNGANGGSGGGGGGMQSYASQVVEQETLQVHHQVKEIMVEHGTIYGPSYGRRWWWWC